MKRVASKRAKIRRLCITLGMAAAVLAYLMLIFIPAQQSIAELRRELERRREYVLAVDRNFAQLVELQDQLRAAEAFVESSRPDGQSKMSMTHLLASITQFARSSNVTLQRVTPGETFAGAALRQQDVDLTVAGGFQQVFSFLAKVESWPGHLWLTNLQIESSGEGGETVMSTLRLTVFTDLPGNSD